MKEYVFDGSLPAFQQELHILGWFQENFTTNPKKLKKMSARIRPSLPSWIQASLCDALERSTDPVKMLQMAFKDLAAYPAIMAGLIADGNHGMIMEGNNIYGISLDTNEKWLNPNKDGKWSLEDESDIIDKALLHWMAKERKRVFKGRLTLFPEFGFTGVPYHAPHRFDDKTWAKLTEIWAKEDNERTNLELQYLLNPELLEEKSDGKDC
jgi:hypothetical protein